MATPGFINNALAIAQVETLTVANTWATNDTATVTVNGRTITLTVGTTATTAQIATELATVLSGTSTASLGAAYSANARGQDIPEFREFTAVASSSTVVLTGVTKGKPFTVTTGETTAGSGTLSRATTIAASGPSHFTGVGNWSTGSVPVDSDDVVFSNGIGELKYAIDQNGVTPASIKIFQSFAGKIGLKNTNTDDSNYPYNEYRDKYLKLCASGDSLNTAVTIGQGVGNGSGRLKLDFNTGQATVVVHNTGQREETDIPALLMKGTHTSNSYDIRKGDVGIGFFVGETSDITTLRTSYVNSLDSDVRLVCGPGVEFNNPTIVIQGGDVTLESATTGGTIVLFGGTLNILGGAHPSITQWGGTINLFGTGTIAAFFGHSGRLDRSKDARSITMTDCMLHAGYDFYDPAGSIVVTNGIKFEDCGPQDLKRFAWGKHHTLTKTSF
jgi:hypothetical protein